MVLIKISTLYYFAQNKYFFLKDIYCIRENMFPPSAVSEGGGGAVALWWFQTPPPPPPPPPPFPLLHPFPFLLRYSFSRGLSPIFGFVLLLSFILKFERGEGVATPVTPPLDLPMLVIIWTSPPVDMEYEMDPIS